MGLRGRTVGKKLLYISTTLSGLDLGLEETDDGIWSISFGNLLLGRYDERAKKLRLL